MALAEDGTLVGKDDLAAQTEQVFRNLEHALHAAGGSLANLVKLTTFVTDIAGIAVFRTVRDRFIGANAARPASSFVEVSALAGPDFLIEVEAIAWMPPSA